MAAASKTWALGSLRLAKREPNVAELPIQGTSRKQRGRHIPEAEPAA